MKITIAFLIALSCFGQGKQNVTQTGVVDATGAQWKFPAVAFASLPAAASNTNARYTVTNCLTVACTAGGGTKKVDLVSNGSAWVAAVNTAAPGVTASSLGAALDCRPDIGTPGANICGVGITPTDDTAVLQAFLDTASASNPIHLIIDGPAYIHGLVLKAGVSTTIEGYGPQTGFWMKPGSNATALDTVGSDSLSAATDNPLCANNAQTNFPGTWPTRAGSLTVRNITINGNRGTFSGATPPAYNRDGNATGVCWQGTTVYLFNVNATSFAKVTIEDVFSLDSPSWNFKISNYIDVQFNNNTARETYGTTGLAGGRVYNGDGLDLCGPGVSAHIGNFTVENSGDDPWSIVGWTGAQGTVSIVGGNFINNTSMGRIIPYVDPALCPTCANGKIDTVNVVGMSGSATENGIITGFQSVGAPTTVADWVKHINISNTHFKAPNFISFQQNPIGEAQVSNSSLSPILQPVTSAVDAAFTFDGTTSGKTQLASLSLSNFEIYRETGAAVAATLIKVPSGATIVRVALEGVRVVNELGGATAAIAAAIDVPSGGAITTLEVGAIDPTLITALVTAGSYSRITTVKGMDRADTSVLSGTPSVATCGTIGTGSTNMAGFITSATTGACVSVLTFVGKTATTGWSCGVSDATTANLISQTGSSTTTATFTGTTVSGDVLRYTCNPY